jgi:hypothetical protein
MALTFATAKPCSEKYLAHKSELIIMEIEIHGWWNLLIILILNPTFVLLYMEGNN